MMAARTSVLVVKRLPATRRPAENSKRDLQGTGNELADQKKARKKTISAEVVRQEA
jgi:hypothetical protein